MHANSLIIMDRLLNKFGGCLEGQLVYDVGSHDVNGTYRSLIESRGAVYKGLDINPGPNVDFAVSEEGGWLESVGHALADMTISGQCLEHVRRPWEWIRHVAQVTKRGSLVIVIAPFIEVEHRYPWDCWRLLPDGMASLFGLVGAEIMESQLDGNDCYAVARLPA